MEIENNSNIAFLDTSVCREPDGRLTTSVYRKPTHTDQYLAYDSHHPQSVKRGIVKCLYDRAKRLVTKTSVISDAKKHLSSVLVSNGYPSSFVQKITKTKTAPRREPVAEVKFTVVLPYIQGVSEPLRCCLEQQGTRTIVKSDTTLWSHLVRPKDTVDPIGHYPIWNEVKFIDRDPDWYTRRFKGAIHIRLHLNNINRE